MSKVLNKAIENIYSLTPLQEGMLFHALGEKDSTSYILQSTLLLRFEPEKKCFQDAIHALSRRYDALRTAIVYEGMAKARQVVLKERIPELRWVDLRQIDRDEAEAELIKMQDREVSAGFDLQKQPLLRFCCVAVKGAWKLIWTMHHIIVDGWCMSLLQKDLLRYYELLRQGMSLEQLLTLIDRERVESTEYSRYVKWLEKQDRDKALAYWGQELEDYHEFVSIRPYEKPKHTAVQMHIHRATVPSQVWKDLRNLSRQHRITMGTLLQTAWGLLLQRYACGKDVVFGKVVSGRNAPLTGIESMVGLFANTIPVRVNAESRETLLDLLRQQQQKAIEGENYAYCSLGDIQSYVGCGEIIGTLFAFENYSVSSEYAEKYSSMSHVEHSREQTNFDLTLSTYEDEQGLHLEFLYDPNVYSAENVSRISAHYEGLLQQIPHGLTLPAERLSCITVEEKEQILGPFNDSDYHGGTHGSLMEIYGQRVQEQPNKTAVVYGAESLTYRELNEKANAVAWTLKELGVSRGDRVAILPKRGIPTIVGLCGILKAGAAYVPIDPGYPEQRIRDILEDARPKAVLTYGCTVETALPVISLDTEASWDIRRSDVPLVNYPEDIANCIYTSGTTGKPKGVLVRHKGIVNLVTECDYMPFSPETNTVQTGQLVFDASTFEIWGTLINGGCLHMIPQELLLDSEAFRNYLIQNQINMQFITTALFNQFVSYDPSMFDGIHAISFGGERVSEEHVRILLERNPKLRLTNCYGPTEATVIALRYTIPYGKEGMIPIGTPVHNTQVYILQGDSLCGIGVPGELCIGGEGLAAGYLNRPELTEEKFVPNPFGTGKLYRTGDLARWLPDGTVDFMGRIDEQVKIRGFRIELAEIESVLCQCQGVKDCAVVVGKNPAGENALFAYVVGQADLTAIKKELGATLPAYMIPAYLTELDSIPLTRNGKLDRKALPQITEQSDREYTPPRDETEEMLLEAFQKVLGVEHISIYDNFFELGGHSLKCARLVNLLRGQVGIKDVFEKKTIAALAEQIRGCAIAEEQGIAKQPDAPWYKMSEAQKRLYIFEELDESKSSYHVTSCYSLEDNFDAQKAEEVFRKLIQRHESLRSSFAFVGEDFRQIVHEKAEYAMERIYLGDDSIEDGVKAYLKPYDLSKPALFRTALAENNRGEQWLILDFHHIIIDGFSVDILLREFETLYNEGELPPQNLQYRDYSAWLEEKDLSKAEAYWLNQFAQPLPDGDLPLDGKRREDLSHKGELVECALPALKKEEVEAFCKKQGVTPYAFFTAAVSAFLGRVYDTEDVALGMPVSCRTHGDTETVVGMLVNTIALRTKPMGDKTFYTYLAEVKENLLSAMEHQEYPFNRLVEKAKAHRSNGRAPLFDVFFNYFHGDTMEVPKGEGFTAKEHPVNIGAGKFDLVFDLVLQGEEYSLICNYRPALLKRETVETLQGMLGNLILSYLQQGDKPLREADSLAEGQKTLLLEKFHRVKDFDRNQTFPHMLRQRAKELPSHTALVFGEEKRTYAELNEQTDAIASYLLQQKVEREEIIAVIARPGFATFLGAIGAMKAGCAYMPIDPAYPTERIRHMLRQSKCRFLLKDEGTYALPENIQTIEISEIVTTPIGTLPELKGDDLAYVIFTSGSTGLPKGVMIEHHSLTNLILWHNRYYDSKASDRSTKYAGFGFDASVHEMYPPLGAGGTIYIIPEEMRMDLPGMAKYVEGEQINVGFFPTPVCEQFAKETVSCLTKVITGGDKLKTYTDQYPIYNNYGPTEGTVLSTAFKVDRAYDNIPIGKPIDNVRIYVVNSQGHLQPVGIPGEIWLSGEGISRGYIHDEERTKQRFIPDPFCPGQRIYKTGDIGKWLPDGNLLYLGRNDFQVKIRGNRVELGEIDALLRMHEGVADCVVVTDRDHKGDTTILAYLSGSEALDLDQMKNELRGKLPSYMIPTGMMQIPAIPYTAHNKPDREALPKIIYEETATFEEPRTERERLIAQAFSKVLGVERVSLRDSFFELGGHSLLIADLLNEIESSMGVRLSFRTIFTHPTVEELAQTFPEDPMNSPILPVEKQPYYPASLAQKNIYIAQERDPDAMGYHIPVAYSVSGKPDLSRLTTAINALVQRHEILRTSFHMVDGEICQVVEDQTTAELGRVDLSEQEEFSTAFTDFIKPFDLKQAPLIRFCLAQRGEEQQLWIDLHHIIADGASMPILLEELSALYEGKVLPKPQLQYRDFTQWLREQDLSSVEKQWQARCALMEDAPDLPKDHRGTTIHSVQLQEPMEAAIADGLKALANRLRTSFHNVLLFGAMVTMERFTGQKKLSLGIPVSMRTAVNLGQLPGMLVNVLPVSCDFTADLTVAQQIKEIEEQVVFANQGVLCDLQGTKASAPSISVVFSQEKSGVQGFFLGDAKLTGLNHSLSSAKYDLIIGVTEEENRQTLTLSYGSEIFERETAQSILDTYCEVLRDLSGSHKEQALCSDLSSLTQEQRNQIMSLAGAAPEEITGDTVLHAICGKRETQPHKIALVYGTKHMTYQELICRAEAYAVTLSDRGLQRGDLVAVFMDDGMEGICALLGAMMAGLAYLPLDPHTPEKRLETILKNSQCKLVLTDRRLSAKIFGCPVLVGDALSAVSEPFAIRADLSDTAYVIYTSGSTGVPKGVAVSHSALKNLVQWHLGQFELTAEDVTTRFAGFGFDASVWEIFPTLTVGGSIHVIPQDLRLDLKALAHYYETNGVTVSFLPTPICEEFMKLPCKSLRIVLTGGDKLNHYESHNAYTLYNNYGPTENTVVATCYEVKNPCDNIPIGKPIRNVQSFVLDQSGQPVPPYGRGELYLGGNSLAQGYYLDPEQTKERFPETAFGRLYRTGDLVRWNPRGELEFLGRQDNQIKINGNRIELGEIEGALFRIPGVQGAAATVVRGEKGSWILAYYTGSCPMGEEEIKKHLMASLPSYMIPRRILPIEAIPLTINGKIDRKALPVLSVWEEKSEKLSLNPTEKTILDIWQGLLGIENIGLSDNFMEIGGNSILVVKMQDALEKSYPGCVSISDIFALPTISMLAEHIDRQQRDGDTITLKAMSLKASLPRGKEPGDSGKVSYAERGILHRKLRELEVQDEKMLRNLLRTVYCASIALLTSEQSVDLYCYEDNGCVALTVPLAQNIGALLSAVTETYERAEKYIAPKVIREQRTDGLICSYGFCSGTENELSRNAELYWNCDLTQEEFRIKAECHKLSDRILKSLLERFLGLLRGVLGVS